LSKTLPFISLILCHHKGDLVIKAISSLLRQKGVKVEIIVMTSEPDRTFYGTKTVYMQGGPDRKRNESLKFCASNYIAFFDDDIEADPYCVYKMYKTLQRPGCAMVFGKLLNMEFRDMFDEAGSFLTPTGFLWSRGDRVRDVGQFNKTIHVLAGKSASCMIHRSVFVAVGKFDTDYEILGEETDLAWRVWLQDYRVYFCPGSIAYHAFNTKFKPRDFYTSKRVYYNGCRNYLSMLYTNLGKGNWQRPIATHLCAWTIAGLGMILTGKTEAGLYIFKGIAYFFRNIKRIHAKRVLIQKNRKIQDSRLFKYIMTNPPKAYYWKRLFRYIASGLHG